MNGLKGRHKKKDFTLAKRLERVMIEKKIYARDVEKMTGIRRQNIYEYIQGVKQPSAYNLKRLSEGLHISADWLLGLKE